jgi:7-carboxy-7-deazaguanine synthase
LSIRWTEGRGARINCGAMSETLVVNEVYLSLQGESTFAGLPCVFVRLTGCNLRCSYCDTAYAFAEGRRMSLADVLAEVRRLAAPFVSGSVAADVRRLTSDERTARQTAESQGDPPHVGGSRLPLVELTGGEPLLQPGALPLMKTLCDDDFTVLLETSGALDIAPVDPRVRRIMDLKCPSSGEVDRNRWENLRHLKATDEIKFVIGTHEDYAWAKQQLAAHRLATNCPVLFSWVHPLKPEQQDKSLKTVPANQTPVTRQQLAEMILADALPVRFQVQMHKVIWPAEQRGV